MARFLTRLGALGALCFLGASHAAPASGNSHPNTILLKLESQQQAALGLRTVPLQASAQTPISASATVKVPPGKEVVVAMPYAGVITQLGVGVGDDVKVGAALVQWRSPQLAELRRLSRESELEVQNAQLALKRDQTLHDEGIIPTARLEQTRQRAANAQATLAARAAESRAADVAGSTAGDSGSASLRASMAGSVVEVLADVGQRLEAGAPVVRLADTRQLWLNLSLAPEKAARLQAGDKVLIPQRQAQAELVSLARAVDSSQQVPARARVTQLGSLRAGELLAVQLMPRTQGGQAGWTVPSRALVVHQGRNWVFVQHPQGVVATQVEVLSSTEDGAVITSPAFALPQTSPTDATTQVVVNGVAALRALLIKSE